MCLNSGHVATFRAPKRQAEERYVVQRVELHANTATEEGLTRKAETAPLTPRLALHPRAL